MRHLAIVVTFLSLAAPVGLSAQTGPEAKSAQPFKLGTFEIEGEPRIGLVLDDKLIVDLEAANRALQRDPAYPPIPLPEEMRDLIARYDTA